MIVQSDYCQCGGFKMATVIMKDGSYIVISPGMEAPSSPDFVLQIEVSCSECGKLHGFDSLVSPIQLYMY